MKVPRTAGSTKPLTQSCRMCGRSWYGKAIARHFYRSYPGAPAGVGGYQSYCIPCYNTVQATRNALNAREEPHLRNVNVPRRIQEQYGAGMLRVCQAAGIKPGNLGRLIAADILQYDTGGQTS